MKSILYIIAASLICLIFAFSSNESSRILVLRPANTNVTPEDITQSGEVIAERLEIYGIKANVSEENREIKVHLPEDANISGIEDLLTKKGEIGFFETLSAKELKDLLKSIEDPIYENDLKNDSGARLACSYAENKVIEEKMLEYLKSVRLSSEYKLLWSKENKNSGPCLYALRISSPDQHSVNKSDMESVRSVNRDNDEFAIEIKFKPVSVQIWAQMTENSLGKSIALVIDDKVFYDPLVRDMETSGRCEITGSFTQKDVKYFLAFAGTKTLPTSFIIQ